MPAKILNLPHVAHTAGWIKENKEESCLTSRSFQAKSRKQTDLSMIQTDLSMMTKTKLKNIYPSNKKEEKDGQTRAFLIGGQEDVSIWRILAVL